MCTVSLRREVWRFGLELRNIRCRRFLANKLHIVVKHVSISASLQHDVSTEQPLDQGCNLVFKHVSNTFKVPGTYVQVVSYYSAEVACV